MLKTMRTAGLCFATLVMLGGSAAVSAQADTQAVLRRLDLLEAAVRALEKELTDLNLFLRAGRAASSPIEAVQPFDLDVAHAAMKGGSDARIAVIEFSDLQCSFCGNYARETYPQLERQFVEPGKVRYIFRHFPIESSHPLALKAAEAVECAREHNTFWELRERLFGNQQELTLPDLLRHAQALGIDQPGLESCLSEGRMTARVRGDLQEGRQLGVTGTPTFFFGLVNSNRTVRVTQKIVGTQPLAVFQAAIQRLLSLPPATGTR